MSQLLSTTEVKRLSDVLREIREKVRTDTCKGWHEWFRGMCYGFVDVGLALLSALDIVSDMLANIMERTTDIAEWMGRDAKRAIVMNNEADAYKTLSLGLTIDLLVSLFIDVIQLKVMGSGVDLDLIEDMVKTVVPMDEIFRSVFASKIRKTYLQWIDVLFNKLYKPWIPDPQTAISLYFQNYISYRDMRELLFWQGIDEKYHRYLLDRVSRNPNIQELVNFYQYTDIDEEWIDRMLVINNTFDLKDKWWKYIKGVALRDELRKVESYVKTLYAQGWISEREISDYLFRYKARQEERDVLMNVWKKLREVELKKMYIDKHEYLLRKKRINCRTFEERVRAIINDDRFAQALAMRECAYLGYDYPTEDIIV